MPLSEPQTTNHRMPGRLARPEIVYLVRHETLASIFSSQVLAPLIRLTDECDVRLVAHVPIGQLVRPRWRRKLRDIRCQAEQAGVRVHWLPSPPSRWPRLWDDGRVLRRFLARAFSKDASFVLHCRNAAMTAMALEASAGYPGARVVFDVRGDDVSETADQRGISDFSETSPDAAVVDAWTRQRFAVERADGVTAVSEAMLEVLEQRYGAVVRRNSLVIPCCPEIEEFLRQQEEREAVRKELGLRDRFVVIYLGSLAWYQMPAHSLRVFRIIRGIIPGAHFFALTTQPEAMRREIELAGIAPEDATIRSVPPHEVPRLLAASDLGLLLRQEDAVNRVASPVKCGEYLAAGIPVVISRNLGDYSRSIAESRLGTVVNLSAADSDLRTQLAPWLEEYLASPGSVRDRCRTFAREHLSWDSFVPRRLELYRRLLRMDGDV